MDIHKLVLESKKKHMKLSRQERITASRYFSTEKLRELENIRNAPNYAFIEEPENNLELIEDPDDYLFDSPDEPWEVYESLLLQCPRRECSGIIHSPNKGIFHCSEPFCSVKVDGIEGSVGTEEFIDRLKQLYIEHEVRRCSCIPRVYSYGIYLSMVCDACGFQAFS